MSSFSQNKISFITLMLIYAFMLTVAFFYYPKWTKGGTEATISWDVSGYYMYLPATFIYGDLKQCAFHKDILDHYRPTPDFQQAFRHASGNYVMKYPVGQAIQFAPLFAIAHIYAGQSSVYPADGFSRPYQIAVAMTSLLFMLLGLWFLRLSLVEYYGDSVTAWTLIGIALGSNYFDYSAITGSMTHNHLFAWYALLIYMTIQFYKKPTSQKAVIIGSVIGIVALTRPTEIISCLIPLCWGVSLFSTASIVDRFVLIKDHWRKYFMATLTCLAIGSIQMIYWKYASGDWVVYSYEDQGFSWLRPHIWDGMMSYRSGWLVYSPLMILSVIGMYFIVKDKRDFSLAVLLFSLLFIYIAFAWDIWWYGGALGQRAMVQAYPVLAFPFASVVSQIINGRLKYFATIIFAGGIYLNLWFTHQAHLGGLLKAGHMTKAYFWKTLGRYEVEPEAIKLLDTTDEFTGERQDVKLIYENDFSKLSADSENQKIPDLKSGTVRLDSDHQYSSKWSIDLSSESGEWVRAQVDVTLTNKEWEIWKMTQFIVSFSKSEEELKTRMIRIQRLVNANGKTTIFFDTKIPEEGADQLIIYFWHSNSTIPVILDNLRIEIFNE